MTKTGYLKRFRFPIVVIKSAILLHMFLPSRLAVLILFFLLRVKVTHKTVCEWTKKFADEVVLPSYKYTSDILICHADEKYVKVRVNGISGGVLRTV